MPVFATPRNRIGRVPLHLPVTEAQRQRFREFLSQRLLPVLRSGRLTRFLVERYRTDLRSSNLPGWVVSDVRQVLDSVTKILDQPTYQEHGSLAGDYGDLAGILDWAKEGIEDVWGGIKTGASEVAAEAVTGVWDPVREKIFGQPDVVVTPEHDRAVPSVEPVEPAVSAPVLAPGVPVWLWLLGAGAVLWFLKK